MSDWVRGKGSEEDSGDERGYGENRVEGQGSEEDLKGGGLWMKGGDLWERVKWAYGRGKCRGLKKHNDTCRGNERCARDIFRDDWKGD